MKRHVCFLFLICFIQAATVQAQPKGIHLSWNGDKTVNATGTIAITWMNEKQDKSSVAYGIDSNILSKTKKAKEKFVSPLNAYMNKTTLKKLKPATYYYYKVGSDQNGWSKIYRFRTAPEVGDTGKIVVGVWSDTQNNGGNLAFEQTDSVLRQMTKHTFHFTTHNGDIVENGSVIKSWVDFFNTAQPLLANNPFMSVTGNHDVVNDTAAQNFQKPFPIFYEFFNLPKDNLNYSYNYGNTHFVAINSGYAQGAAKVNKVLFDKNSEEYKWLAADLEKARKDKRIKWVIVYCHYPMYSYGFSFIPQWQKNITPLLDKYNVDLCLSGHRHVYERHTAIKNHEIIAQKDFHVYQQPAGTVYITNGSAGGSLQGIGGSNLPSMVFTSKEKVYNYAIMTIEGNCIQYEVYDKAGKRMDYFTIKK